MENVKEVLDEIKNEVEKPEPVRETEQDERIKELESTISELSEIVAATYEKMKFFEGQLNVIELKLFGGVAQIQDDKPGKAKVSKPSVQEKTAPPEKKRGLVAKLLGVEE